MATVGVKGLNVIIDTGRVVRNDAVQSWTWVHFAGSNVRVVLVPIHRIPSDGNNFTCIQHFDLMHAVNDANSNLQLY